MHFIGLDIHKKTTLLGGVSFWSVSGTGPISVTQRLLLVDLQFPHGVNNIGSALSMLA
jgi:hypothetical protein